jgi:hypothetical protein
MKKSVLILSTASIIIAFASVATAGAQETSKEIKEKKEKEYEMQKAIDEQKKAMVDQKKVQEEMLENLQKQQEALDQDIKDIDVEVQVDEPDSIFVRAPRVRWISRSKHMGEPFPALAPGLNSFEYHSFMDDNENTSWEFSKRIKEKSLKNEYLVEVEKSSNSVVMSVNGDCKEGEIRIKIVMPGGKTYSDVVIDEFGNLNWRKSFTISETENQDKAGAWKFIITSNKATGYFKISLQAY